jgi:hypothetical protein
MSDINNTYAVIDENNIAKNFILWDGVSLYDPGESFKLVKINPGISYNYGWKYDPETQLFYEIV